MEKMTAALHQIRKRHIWQIRLTCDILGHILQNVSEEQAHELRDGPQGWSIVEIVCHLRDFDDIFYRRANMMLEQDHPQLPAYDHEAMAIESAYQRQSAAAAYEALKASRRRFIDFFKSLTEQQWQRGGIHPERGGFTMTDALIQVGLHDIDHLEQITRVLKQTTHTAGEME